jgi:hypothetical protein
MEITILIIQYHNHKFMWRLLNHLTLQYNMILQKNIVLLQTQLINKMIIS